MKVTEALIVLETVNLFRPKRYMIERLGYSEHVATEVDSEYRKFIALTVANPKVTLPTCKEVDDMWHAHILCTHDYIDMCSKLGVEYIHHNPCLSHEKGTIGGCYNRDTLGLYVKNFGEPHSFWTADQELCSGDTDYCNSVVLERKNAHQLALSN